MSSFELTVDVACHKYLNRFITNKHYLSGSIWMENWTQPNKLSMKMNDFMTDWLIEWMKSYVVHK